MNFALPVTDSTLVAYKNGFSAYREAPIAEYVAQYGYSDIILTGVFEMCDKDKLLGSCVSATARDFSAAGYEVAIPAEATLGVSALPLGERQALHAWFAEIIPVQQLFDRLDEPSSHSCRCKPAARHIANG